jgi:hypothetical protein
MERSLWVGIYIVEVSSQLLNVLLQLIRCLQAILEETEREYRADIRIPLFTVIWWGVASFTSFRNVKCHRMFI